MITDIQNTRDVQIVRAVFGNFDFNLIPASPQFNEVVYVWGIENKSILDSKGYTTILCDRNNLNFKYKSFLYIFMHKILALKKATESYSKFLFLDWDCDLLKNLDDSFFNYLNSKEFLAPLYSYDKSAFDNVQSNSDDWDYNNSIQMKNYSWEYDGLYVLPNAGFIYVNNSNILSTILETTLSNKLKCLVEEYAIYIISNTTLDGYIEVYHPKVCNSSRSELLTNYISNIIDTDYYFQFR